MLRLVILTDLIKHTQIINRTSRRSLKMIK